MVDNDAGGIVTYSQAGARCGYLPLWTLLPITVVLIITQEMCSRMGAVTGKGLSDLIREEFGLRITFLMMALLVLAEPDQRHGGVRGHCRVRSSCSTSATTSRVPLAAVVVWFLAVKGNYQQRGEDLPVRLRHLRHLHHLRIPGEAGLEGSGHLQRQAGADAGCAVTSTC